MPSRADVARLAAHREPHSVTIHLPTNPSGGNVAHQQLLARPLIERAIEQVSASADKQTATALADELNDLLEDEDFWSSLGRGLVVLATPTHIVEYRLPFDVIEYVGVADRFAFTPLLQAISSPRAALVLAMSHDRTRLFEWIEGLAPTEIAVPGMPANAPGIVGLRSIGGRSPYGRLQGDEGRKVRLTQYARAVDHALRPLLNGHSLPLILAANEPLASIYRNLSGYDGLVPWGLRGNPDELSDGDLVELTRGILDQVAAARLDDLRSVFADRAGSGRASTDLSDLSRAAAFGALATLAVDADTEVRGTVTDDGTLDLDHPEHDVLEEIARRALATGAQVLAVRAGELPDGVSAAGILRYAV